MIVLALYFLSAFGLAYLVGHSVISRPVRTLIGGPVDKPRAYFGLLVALLECPACFGTWTGAAVGAAMPGLFFSSSSWMAGAMIGACATAGANFILGTLTHLMPESEDPMKTAALAMLQASQEQLNRERSPILNLRDFPYSDMMDRSLKMRAAADGHLSPDLGLLEEIRRKYEEGVVPLTIEEMEILLEADEHDDALRVEGFVPDAEIERAEANERNAPEDTPENWQKYRDAQDFADKLAHEISMKRGPGYWDPLLDWAHPDAARREAAQKHERQHRADDYNLRVARENAGAARPKEPKPLPGLREAEPSDRDLEPLSPDLVSPIALELMEARTAASVNTSIPPAEFHALKSIGIDAEEEF